jgi:hypothetical protein
MTQGQIDAKDTLTTELTIDEWNIVLKGLGELPAKESLDIIQKIQKSFIDKQQKAKATPRVKEDINQGQLDFGSESK